MNIVPICQQCDHGCHYQFSKSQFEHLCNPSRRCRCRHLCKRDILKCRNVKNIPHQIWEYQEGETDYQDCYYDVCTEPTRPLPRFPFAPTSTTRLTQRPSSIFFRLQPASTQWWWESPRSQDRSRSPSRSAARRTLSAPTSIRSFSAP